MVLAFQPKKPEGAHLTSPANASSVPGRTHTAVVGSSGAANPRVPVLKLTVVSLSPTLAGLDFALCRLKSHMAEDLLRMPPPLPASPEQKAGQKETHVARAPARKHAV